MKKLVLVGLVILLFAVSANAETLWIPATTEDGVYSSVLQNGTTYLFEVSGTYDYFDGEALADAEFYEGRYHNNNWVEVSSPFWTLDRDALDVVLNNFTFVDWLGSADGINWTPHTYSPNHVYRYYYIGKGEQVKYHIADSYPLIHPAGGTDYYYDNSGELKLDVVPVPEPASLAVILGFAPAGIMLLKKKRA